VVRPWLPPMERSRKLDTDETKWASSDRRLRRRAPVHDVAPRRRAPATYGAARWRGPSPFLPLAPDGGGYRIRCEEQQCQTNPMSVSPRSRTLEVCAELTARQLWPYPSSLRSIRSGMRWRRRGAGRGGGHWVAAA
jgi:hypothetical protein